MLRSGRAKGRGKDGSRRQDENEAHCDSWLEISKQKALEIL